MRIKDASLDALKRMRDQYEDTLREKSDPTTAEMLRQVNEEIGRRGESA